MINGAFRWSGPNIISSSDDVRVQVFGASVEGDGDRGRRGFANLGKTGS